MGLITAFRHAFRPNENATLIIKVTHGAHHPEDLDRLKVAAKSAGAIIIDQRLPKEELNGLIAACNCYVSLHRSEGLGLTIAEAMMSGKPSIATGYSGNLDFMDEDNSLLVGYNLVEIESDAGPYEKGHRWPYEKGHRWAEPSIPEAANAMRWVFDHPEEARLLGERPAYQLCTVSLPRNAAAECSSVSIRFVVSEAEGESMEKHLWICVQALESQSGYGSSLADAPVR